MAKENGIELSRDKIKLMLSFLFILSFLAACSTMPDTSSIGINTETDQTDSVAALSSPSSIPAEERFRIVELGVNTGYLGSTKPKMQAVIQLKKDGFTKLRTYEPFTKAMVPYKKQVPERLKAMTDLGFTVLFDISNFPYPWMRKPKPEDPDYITRARSHTNRFPPEDPQKYKAFLKDILSEINTRGFMDKIEFEIGNEPDALMYFWGTPEKFFEYYHITYDLVKEYKRPTYCCGFTSTLLTNPKELQNTYITLINKDSLINSDKVDLSYHYYSNTHLGDFPIQNAGLENISGSIITEFNISTKITPQKFGTEYNSPGYVNKLAEVLEFCYRNEVKEIYLFNLMDDPAKDSKMGLFDEAAKPKPVYDLVLKVRSVVKDGFYPDKTENATIFTGRKESLILARKEIDLSAYTGRIIASSSALTPGKSLSPGEWVIIKNQ